MITELLQPLLSYLGIGLIPALLVAILIILILKDQEALYVSINL